MEFPDYVIKRLYSLFKDLPIDEGSEEWKALQIAVSLLNSPDCFKKKIRVEIFSRFYAREEGYYIRHEISIKLYPHKISMRRIFSEYSTYRDKNPSNTYRYIYPNDKYGIEDFNKVLYNLDNLFEVDSYISESDGASHQINKSNFSIKAIL